MELQVWVFGPVRAQVLGQESPPLVSQRARMLLAYLALQPGRSHVREVLAARLWPDAAAESARHRLRQALSELRATLGEAVVRTEGRELLSLAPCTTERELLRNALREPLQRERLEEALVACLGEALEGIYEDWAVAARSELEGLRERVQLALASLPPFPSASPKPLPLPLTRFFGREAECEQLQTLLQNPYVRLITLLGPGGSGKTRLALELAQRERRPVGFVSLVGVSSAEQVLSLVRDALGAGQGTPLEALRAHLSSLTQPLLVLDNLEFLVGERLSAELVRLLEAVPQLVCVATSQLPLGIAGEREFPLAPLRVPNLPYSSERLLEYPSVQLFLDRARAVRPELELTPSTAEAIGQICTRLEGIPLALELAAARMRALTAQQVYQQLERPLDFLVRTRPGGEQRHSSLRVALQGSYILLKDEEQRAFRALAVFRAGFTLSAAAAVLQDPETLPRLECLRDHSLVVVYEQEEAVRFVLLEPLRELAHELLTPDESAAFAERHAGYYLTLAEEASPGLVGPELAKSLALLDRERANLFQAAAHFIAQDDLPRRLRWAEALAQYFVLRGESRELQHHVEPVLKALEPKLESLPQPLQRLWVRRAGGLGNVLRILGELTAAHHWLQSSWFWAERFGLEDRVAYAQLYLGAVLVAKKQIAEAERHATEAECRYAALEPSLLLGVARARLAVVRRHQGRYEEAEALLLSAEAVHREVGNLRGIYEVWCYRVRLELVRGNAALAGELLTQAIQPFLTIGDRGNWRMLCEYGVEVCFALQDYPYSVLALGHTRYLQQTRHVDTSADTQEWFQSYAQKNQQELGGEAYTALFEEGMRLSTRLVLVRLEEALRNRTQGGR